MNVIRYLKFINYCKSFFSKYVKTEDIKKDIINNISKIPIVKNTIEMVNKVDEINVVNTNTETDDSKPIMTQIQKDNFNATGLMQDTDKKLEDNRFEKINRIDFDVYKDPKIIGTGSNVLLILDDVQYMSDLYNVTFDNIKRKYNFDILNTFKLIKCIGPDAGYVAYKYLVKEKINFALIDITLGKIIKNKDNERIEIDGVDIALKLLELYPDIKLRFVTSHTSNKKNHTMIYYYNKFENITKKDITDFFINKNGNMDNDIYEFLKDGVSNES